MGDKGTGSKKQSKPKERSQKTAADAGRLSGEAAGGKKEAVGKKGKRS